MAFGKVQPSYTTKTIKCPYYRTLVLLKKRKKENSGKRILKLSVAPVGYVKPNKMTNDKFLFNKGPPAVLLLLALVTVNGAGRVNYWLDSFYWFGLGVGGSGLYGRFFSCFIFSPQETAGFVFSFKCPFKKKIRAIIRRQEFVQGSSPKHLIPILGGSPGRAA